MLCKLKFFVNWTDTLNQIYSIFWIIPSPKTTVPSISGFRQDSLKYNLKLIACQNIEKIKWIITIIQFFYQFCSILNHQSKLEIWAE